MPSVTALIGYGVPPKQASVLGNVVTTKTPVGTTQAGATTITSNFTLAAATTGQVSLLLPAEMVGAGPIIIANTAVTAVTLTVFPEVGGSILGAGGTNLAFSIPQNKTALFYRISSTTWVVNLSA